MFSTFEKDKAYNIEIRGKIMRILIVRSFPDILNLNTYNVQEIGLAKALTGRGIKCDIVLYSGNMPSRTEIYEFEQDGKSQKFLIYWLRGIGILKNALMPSVFRLLKAYDVIQVHEYDQVLSWMIYASRKMPTIIYHGPYYHEYAKGYNLKCKVFDNLFLRWKKYNHVVALAKSQLAADFLRKKGFQHVYAVGVGLDQEKFEVNAGENVKDILKQNEKKFRLLYVGKIEPRRNVYFLVDLFISLEKEYPETELIIVGDGEKKYVQNFLDEISPYIKAGKIRYFKRATQKELVSVYKNSNLFIFTSNYEIFGMVLLEAMYFGLPVISSMNGGASVLIQEDKNGYIMQGFQIELWKERIVEIMRDYEKYKRMKESAHQRVVDKFLWDKLADQFIKGYQEAIELFKRQ